MPGAPTTDKLVLTREEFTDCIDVAYPLLNTAPPRGTVRFRAAAVAVKAYKMGTELQVDVDSRVIYATALFAPTGVHPDLLRTGMITLDSALHVKDLQTTFSDALACGVAWFGTAAFEAAARGISIPFGRPQRELHDITWLADATTTGAGFACSIPQRLNEIQRGAPGPRRDAAKASRNVLGEVAARYGIPCQGNTKTRPGKVPPRP